MSNQIGTLNEKPLHAALKEWYARPEDHFERVVDNYVIDIVRGRLLIEIQTGSFSAIRHKLGDLVQRHPVRLVYPIAREKWIVKLGASGEPTNRRKSPKRGGVEELFAELVSFPTLLADPNFSLDVLLVQEEEHLCYRGGRRWRRRGWITHERHLLAVLERHLFQSPADLASLLPAGLGVPFGTADLAAAGGVSRRLAQKMAYCLREIGAIAAVSKQGNAVLYTIP